MFRKEMKKWTYILWVIIFSIPLSSLSLWYFRDKGPGSAVVATIDGDEISEGEYQRALMGIQARIQQLRAQAQQYGFDPQMFISGSGLQDPEAAAFKQVVERKLLGRVDEDLQLQVDDDIVTKELLKGIPDDFIQDGRINQQALEMNLRHMNMTIDEFEQSVEHDLKRQLILNFATESAYAPSYVVKHKYAQENAKKSFSYVQVPLKTFIDREKKKEITTEQLATYFNENRETYRVPEKREALFASINADAYVKNIQVGDEDITAFYEKNKTSLYRIPPEIKVRRILFRIAPDATDEDRIAAKEKAQKVLDQAKTDPDKFAALAKRHSDDKESAGKGGALDFFKRGSHNEAFEAVAFRLQEQNEIGEMVQTSDGVELIQLVERRSATYKPLEGVRKDIVDTLKVRKAERAVKSDLEIMRHSLRSDQDALVKFINAKGLKAVATPSFSKAEATGRGRTAQVVEKVFARSDDKATQGYFADGKDFVLYKEEKRHKSFVPKLADIRDKLQEDYTNSKAWESLRRFVKKRRSDLLAGRTSLDGVAKSIGSQVQSTGIADKNGKPAGLEKVSGFMNAAFELTDPRQVLKFKHEDDRYLVQLATIDPADMAKYQEVASKLISADLAARKRLNSSTFIASLRRNAKLETINTAQTSMPV